MPAEMFGATPLGHDAVARLEEWSQGLGPARLWLEGPVLACDDVENPVTGAAAKFIRLAEIHRLTVVSYFCEVPRSRSGSGQSDPEMTGAIGLLYALLRQMVEVLSPRLDTTIDLSEDRFTALDGTPDTWAQATALLRDVVSVVSGTVFCVIDGLHWLDSTSTDVPLAELLHVLRKDNLRVLVTTSGRCGCLLEEFEREETCSLQHSSPYRTAQGLYWGLPS